VSETPAFVAPAEGPIQHADNLIAIRRYAEALPWIARAIAADPDSAWPYCLLARALIPLGQYRRALKAAETSVLRDPENEWPHRLRSACLRGLGKKRQALEAAQEAARLGPDIPEALYALVCAQLDCNQTRAARATAERLGTIAADDIFAHKALGLAALTAGQWSGAEAHFRRALALDPQDVEALIWMGGALQRQGRRLEALERIHNAARIEPAEDSIRLHLQATLGWYLGSIVLLVVEAALVLTWGIMDAKRSPLALVALLVMAAVAVGWVLWRRARIRALPEHLALLVRHERVWAPLPTGRDTAIVITVILAVATLGAALVSIALQLAARDRTVLSVFVALAVVVYVTIVVVVLVWARTRLGRRPTA
jgi:tetratricopeptide (TPR) repeat protein